MTFSSSSLLNRHFDIFEPDLRSYLDHVRARVNLDEFIEIIDMVKEKSVLMVGDTIIDEYQYVSPLGKSPKENLIPTLYRNAETFAGGIIAAANHVAGFCRDVHVVTCLGDKDGTEELVRSALSPNVKLTVIHRPSLPTTRKRRFIDADYLRKLFEVYFMDDAPLTGAPEAQLIAAIAKQAPGCDVVVVADFGHGMITSRVRDELIRRSRFLAVNTQTNSANLGFNLITKYSRADISASMHRRRDWRPVNRISNSNSSPRKSCRLPSIAPGSFSPMAVMAASPMTAKLACGGSRPLPDVRSIRWGRATPSFRLPRRW